MPEELLDIVDEENTPTGEVDSVMWMPKSEIEKNRAEKPDDWSGPTGVFIRSCNWINFPN